MQNAQIQLSHVSKTVAQGNDTLTILNNISYTFEQKYSYAIKGVSGSGKSTLLSIIAGFTEPTSGTVLFNNRVLQSMSKKDYQEYIQQSIGIVFQHAYLIPELTVLENVLLKSIITNQQELYKTRALELLDRVGLSHKTHERPFVLSGGEQQRIAIIRALLMRPTFLIADEPTSHLDHETGRVIINLLQEFHTEENVGLIMSTHDEGLASLMNHSLSLKSGSLCHVR
jgi:ABC-type lipoprotein export system ATPase subunit